MSENFTEFLSLEFLSLGIFGKDYDGQDNGKLLEIKDLANQEVTTELRGYHELPIPEGDEMFRPCRNAARIYAKALWAEFNENYESYKTNIEIYDKKIAKIIEALKTEPNTRTTRVSTGTDYQTRRLYSQVKRY